MSPAGTDIRRQVLAQIITFMAEAERDGSDPVESAKRAFPGTPETVLWSAWWELEERKTEAWWQSVEKTIDGEVITRALTSAKAGDA